ncbi:hypothetical protein [Aeromonas veronii]|uniref:hypothetical protein n=1 Tax=Aeromonas veronii TaxID=654 RepID=UPI000EB3B43F|nr:hypothetical protein [Aeromonas veronii]AYK20419.1 hypothetical protein C0073_021820 [Aeromonas veronii]
MKVGETSRRHENTLLGERIIVLDKHERAFSQTVNNGEPAIQLEAAQPGLEWGQLHDAGVGEEGV